MKNRAFAWVNLAYRMALHVLFRMPRRALGKSRDYEEFIGTVAPEGYVPMTTDERAQFPRFTRCFHCGLCSMAAPPVMSAWDEPWTFVAGPSRSLDRAPLVNARVDASVIRPDTTSVCPAGVPIDFMARTIRRMATEPEKLS